MLGFLTPTPNRDPAQPHLLPCLRNGVKGWQLGQVSPPFRALFATSEAPWPSARWLLRLPGSTLLLPWHSLTPQLTGTLSWHSARGTWLGTETVRLGWLPCMGWRGAGAPLAGCPLPCPSGWTGSPFTAQGRSSRLLAGWQALSSPPGKGTGDARSCCPVLDTRARGTSLLCQLIPPSLLPVAPSPSLPSRLVSGTVL